MPFLVFQGHAAHVGIARRTKISSSLDRSIRLGTIRGSNRLVHYERTRVKIDAASRTIARASATNHLQPRTKAKQVPGPSREREHSRCSQPDTPPLGVFLFIIVRACPPATECQHSSAHTCDYLFFFFLLSAYQNTHTHTTDYFFVRILFFCSRLEKVSSAV